jgi:AraC family transcriptional regulator
VLQSILAHFIGKGSLHASSRPHLPASMTADAAQEALALQNPFQQAQQAPLVRRVFPDLGWLKSQASQGTWPTLIMNATTSQSWRPDIRGPLTLFLNLQGTSHCAVDAYRVPVSEEVCFITNAAQHYSLEIDSRTPVETYNLHFSQTLIEQSLQSLLLPADRLLTGEQAVPDFCFPNRLFPKAALMPQLQRIRQAETNAPALEAALLELLLQLLASQREIRSEIARLPALKQATRSEIHTRLNRARDYLFSSQEPLSLDQLAAEACLSKYHFLRLFKAAYHCTPHQFQLRLRMERARSLLAHTRLSVQEIAWSLGCEDAGVFSRQFRSQVGVYPSQYRAG